MPIGITNATATSLANITSIVNITDPGEFFIRADQIMFGGWFWFIIIIVLGIIVYIAAQEFNDQPLANFMYTTAALTAVAFLNRAYCVTFRGATACLINDWQMWMFPIGLVASATILYFIKD